MKHFFALPAVLRTTALLAAASAHTFSVGDDLLAFPQFEVSFNTEEWVLEHDAAAKLAPPNTASSANDPPSPSLSEQTASSATDVHLQSISTSGDHAASPAHPSSRADPPIEYEYMVGSDGQRWLCSIPRPIDASPGSGSNGSGTNETQAQAAARAAAEEARELARATDRGWELLAAMQGKCIFFTRDWWSYSFCYDMGVRQFHALPPGRGVPFYPPTEDPNVEGFMLGTYEKREGADGEEERGVEEREWTGESALEEREGAKRGGSSSGELVQRGDTRYLVQRLGGGTTCDLTGKERKIEVQFHCNPHSPDRISLLKETSTCAYLMVIQTPRLCNDVAFLPPQKYDAHAISCKPILTDEEADIYESELQAEKAAQHDAANHGAGDDGLTAPQMQLVGDVWLGGHDIVPKGRKIEKSAIVGGKEKVVGVLESSDDGKMSSVELEKLGIKDSKEAKQVAKHVKDFEAMAGGRKWRMDIIDTPRGHEYRVVVGEPSEDEKKTEKKGKKKSKSKQDGEDEEQRSDEADVDEGSEEEYYKEEL